jgi:hypothetical protein
VTSTRQAQHLLAGVGFPIAADGDYGAKTRQAVAWFQESWTSSRLGVDGQWGPATESAVQQCLGQGKRVSAHFSLPEFACSHCRWPRAHRDLLRGLEALRAAHYRKSGIAIVSGYRCEVHNAAIKGARGSQHLQGRAADVPPHGDGGKLVTVEQVALLRAFGGLELQPRISGRGCTHVDVRAGGDPDRPAIFTWA